MHCTCDELVGGPGRSVPDIWAGFQSALADLGLELDLWEKPQELIAATPLSENTRDRTFVPEHLNAGFWAGDDNAPDPGFFAYVYPRPAGCEAAPIEPDYAGWVEAVGEWLMPYEAVRACPDPRQAILDLLGASYRVATTLGSWDPASQQYIRPPAPKRG